LGDDKGMRILPRAALPLAVLLAAAGCTNTGTTLNGSTPASGNALAAATPQGTTSAPATTGSATAGPTAAQLAAIAPKTHIQFAPIIGAPEQLVGPLSQQLAADAKADGISIVPGKTAGATHILKGYFSAFSEGQKTTVVYVWDVLDPSGNRLHRIEGQEVTTGSGSGWTAVSQAVMQKIADDTIRQFASWLVQAKA
jgi:hypothetical protein